MTGQPAQDDDRETDDGEFAPPPRPWSPRAQAVAAVLWSSFLAACFATMVFFAFVDPGMIHEDAAHEMEMTRMTGYGIGFFFFWAVTAIASAVSVYLVRTSRLPEGDGDRPR